MKLRIGTMIVLIDVISIEMTTIHSLISLLLGVGFFGLPIYVSPFF